MKYVRMYRLLFQEGPYKGKRLAVQQGTVVIGRDPDCHIHLADDEISWRHAIIEDRDDGTYIRDMGSLNKIVLNGEEIHESKLDHGDEIVIGQTKFIFQLVQVGFVQEGRRISHIQGITFASVAVIVLLEIVLLVALAAWRVDRGGGLDVVAIEKELTREAARRTAEKKAMLKKQAKPVKEPEKKPEEKPKAEPVKEVKPEPPKPAAKPEKPAKPEKSATEKPPPPKPAEEKKVEKKPEKKAEKVEERVKKVIELPPMDKEPPKQPEPKKPAVDDTIRLAKQPPFMEAGTKAADDPLLQLAQEMYEEALFEIKKHNLIQADQQLERLQIVAPDFFPAYAERGILYESQGKLKEAGEQWAELLKRCVGTPWHSYAVEERSRVAQEEGMRDHVTPPQGARPSAERPQTLPKRVIVDSVQRQKFSSSDEFDEMRLITVTLRHRSGRKYIQGEDVKVKVAFYDREEKTDATYLTRAFVPEESLGFEDEWRLGDRRTVSAAYIVPKGFRKREKKDLGEERSYYGYMVRVYHEGVLQDEVSRPKSLLKLFSAGDVSRR